MDVYRLRITWENPHAVRDGLATHAAMGRKMNNYKDILASIRPHGLLLFSLLLLVSMETSAANYPCSGKKGGVARCDGELFVCNDGSISGSKRHCSLERGMPGAPLRETATGDCPCGGGVLCVGPRGGRYCLTPAGGKSYKRS